MLGVQSMQNIIMQIIYNLFIFTHHKVKK